MDPNQRTSAALLDRANTDIAQLLRRFENIIAFESEDKQNRNATAVGAYQMEVETGALIRAAEDILSLTRILKEAWLFGKLQTVGASEAETRAEAAAVKVASGLGRLQGTRSDGVEEEATESKAEIRFSNGDGGVGKEEGEGRRM